MKVHLPSEIQDRIYHEQTCKIARAYIGKSCTTYIYIYIYVYIYILQCCKYTLCLVRVMSHVLKILRTWAKALTPSDPVTTRKPPLRPDRGSPPFEPEICRCPSESLGPVLDGFGSRKVQVQVAFASLLLSLGLPRRR